MGNIIERREFPALDIAKFILAILVVAIHVEPFTGITKVVLVYGIARIADPLFFAITSFLMFQKAYQSDLAWKLLGKYIKRVAILYAVWVILYMPFIVELARKELQMGYAFVETELPYWTKLVLFILKKIILIGPYGALWFLTALLLAMPLTFIVGKKLGSRWCVIISFPWFLLSVLDAYGIHTEITLQITDKIKSIFGWLGNGLTFGFFFCALGMHAAWLYKNNFEKEKERQGVRKGVCGGMILLLLLETYGITRFQWAKEYGAMVCLIPVTWICLQILIYSNVSSGTKLLYFRKSSILIFTLHYGVMDVMSYLNQNMYWYVENGTIQYLFVLGITLIIAFVLIFLSRKIGILKYLY